MKSLNYKLIPYEVICAFPYIEPDEREGYSEEICQIVKDCLTKTYKIMSYDYGLTLKLYLEDRNYETIAEITGVKQRATIQHRLDIIILFLQKLIAYELLVNKDTIWGIIRENVGEKNTVLLASLLQPKSKKDITKSLVIRKHKYIKNTNSVLNSIAEMGKFNTDVNVIYEYIVAYRKMMINVLRQGEGNDE